jgi:hypothetical protein
LIESLNVKPQTVKLLEENIGKSSMPLMLAKNFLDMTPSSQAIKATIDKWDCVKLKSF